MKRWSFPLLSAPLWLAAAAAAATTADKGDTQAWKAYSVCVAASLQSQLVDIAKQPRTASRPAGSTLVTRGRQACNSFREKLIALADSTPEGMNDFETKERALVDALDQVASNALNR